MEKFQFQYLGEWSWFSKYTYTIPSCTPGLLLLPCFWYCKHLLHSLTDPTLPSASGALFRLLQDLKFGVLGFQFPYVGRKMLLHQRLRLPAGCVWLPNCSGSKVKMSVAHNQKCIWLWPYKWVKQGRWNINSFGMNSRWPESYSKLPFVYA